VIWNMLMIMFVLG